MKHIIYLHGFASSAKGTKAQYLRPRLEVMPDVVFHAIEMAPTPIDFTYQTVTGMINRLRQYILDRELAEVSLIGSSMGGLVSLNYAHRFPGVTRLLLLAPALTYISGDRVGMPVAEWQEKGAGEIFHYGLNQSVLLRSDFEEDGRFYQTTSPPPVPITILHGTKDEVVPVPASREYAQAYPDQVQLVEVEAGHDINAYLPKIWELTEQFLLTDEDIK